jgi:hypothetical protein
MRIALALVVLVSLTSFATEWEPLKGRPDAKAAPEPAKKKVKVDKEYKKAIENAAAMTSNARIAKLVQAEGLQIMNITWEDTGRFKDSAVGPNISDMSIQVAQQQEDGQHQLTLMPVIRYDNFIDKTSDVDPSAFTLLVGNEKGGELKRISLREFLEDPTKYLHNAKSFLNAKKSLLAERDKRVLVSAQASFLPVPKKGIAEFNPVIFNYQSVSGDPAVLTMLVTRQGTSTTIIDNKRDSLDGSWGQRLFHNQNGQKASLTGQRMTDFAKSAEGKKTIKDSAKLDVKKSSGMNMVLLIQVPLKQKNPPARGKGAGDDVEYMMAAEGAPMKEANSKSDVEAAVIGHGELAGPYTEIDNLSIERDPQFPVRVTVQFYKATATGSADAKDIKQIKQEIDSVLNSGENVGSLVVAGDTGRITEYEGAKVQPPGWWKEFWKRHEQNTGETRDQAIAKLRKLLGDNYVEQPVCELFLSEQLKRKTM